MNIERILTDVYTFAFHSKKSPTTHDREIQTAVKESQRKIGSWRKVLWLCGIASDGRKTQIPRLTFAHKGARFRLDAHSQKTLAGLFSSAGYRKEILKP